MGVIVGACVGSGSGVVVGVIVSVDVGRMIGARVGNWIWIGVGWSGEPARVGVAVKNGVMVDVRFGEAVRALSVARASLVEDGVLEGAEANKTAPRQ